MCITIESKSWLCLVFNVYKGDTHENINIKWEGQKGSIQL